MSLHKDAIPMEMLDDNLTALIEAGGYDSERELLRDALEALIDANPELRLEMAITLWRQNKITLGRAVEIAQSDRESFKDELAARGLNVVIDVDKEDILRGEELIRQLRRTNDSI
jgi:predicted HTH domain antitoxin